MSDVFGLGVGPFEAVPSLIPEGKDEICISVNGNQLCTWIARDMPLEKTLEKVKALFAEAYINDFGAKLVPRDFKINVRATHNQLNGIFGEDSDSPNKCQLTDEQVEEIERRHHEDFLKEQARYEASQKRAEEFKAYLDLLKPVSESLIGQIMINHGFIAPKQLERALMIQKNKPELRIGEILFQLGYIDDASIVMARSAQGPNYIPNEC